MPTLAAVCLADVPKRGWVGGEGAWQSGPQGGSLKAIQFLLSGGRQDRGEGWVGTWGSLCTAVYIQGCSLSGTRCGRLCVCDPPLPCALHDL